MNLLVQHSILVLFFALLLEIMETGEAYKLIRPHKYYQRRPWHRPRWYTGHKSSKFYNSKRIPPEDYYYRQPGKHRYHSVRDDFDSHIERQPYTIVIELPKSDHGITHNNYLDRKRNYDRDSYPVYGNDEDYIEDDEDFDSKVFNVRDKKLQIKMIKGENPKLHIKISRDDDEKDIEIVDKLNVTTMGVPFLARMYANVTLSMQNADDSLAEDSTESTTPYLEKASVKII